MDNATTTETEAKPALEIETCSRCGGGGKYSWCRQYQDRCFKCAGKGTTLSKRGAAASAFLVWLLSVPAREIKVGDRIRTISLTGAGEVSDHWATVTEVTPASSWKRVMVEGDAFFEAAHPTRCIHTTIAGVETPDGLGWVKTEDRIHVSTKSKLGSGSKTLALAEEVRRARSEEEKAPLVALAVAFQSTLSKTGKQTRATQKWLAAVGG